MIRLGPVLQIRFTTSAWHENNAPLSSSARICFPFFKAYASESIQTEQIQRKHRCFANAVLLQVPLKPIQRHFIQRQLHQPQAHLIDGEIMKAAVLAETDQTATRVYPREPFLRPFVEE